jgi:hypothetical protein
MPRKQHKYHYIYKTTNLINGKYYIGMHSTSDLNDGYIGSGDRIRKSIIKYGKENFKCEILEMFPNRKLLKERENLIVNEELLLDKKCMNLVFGGGGGYISPEGVKKGRQKTDEILKEKYGENFRSVISKKYYDNLSLEERKLLNEKIKIGQKNSGYDCGKIWRGKHLNDEHKKKIGKSNSIKQKGEKNSQYNTCWITNGIENKKIKKEDLIPEGWILGRTIKKGGMV